MLDCLLACLYLCDVTVPEQAGGVWCAALGAVAVHVLTSTCKVLMPCTCPCTTQTTDWRLHTQSPDWSCGVCRNVAMWACMRAIPAHNLLVLHACRQDSVACLANSKLQRHV